MVGRTNVGGGGSVQEAFAFIHVTFPDTTTSCTATKTDGSSTITLVAHGTTNLEEGQLHYMFCVPESGAWNIFATNGTKTATATCVMLIRNQLNEVTFRFTRLPEGYQEVEYIQNTGDYGVALFASDSNEQIQKTQEFDVEFSIPSKTASNGSNTSGHNSYVMEIGQVYQVTAASAQIEYYANTDVSYYGYGSPLSSNTNAITKTITTDTKYTVVFNNSSNKCLLNSEVIDTITPGNITDEGWTSLARGLQVISPITSGSETQMRLYSAVLKSHSGGTKVHDWIPCTRNSDSRIGVYDIVTNTFTACQSNSYFVTGENV